MSGVPNARYTYPSNLFAFLCPQGLVQGLYYKRNLETEPPYTGVVGGHRDPDLTLDRVVDRPVVDRFRDHHFRDFRKHALGRGWFGDQERDVPTWPWPFRIQSRDDRVMEKVPPEASGAHVVKRGQEVKGVGSV